MRRLKHLLILMVVALTALSPGVLAQEEALSGEIVISFQSNDTQTWEALCAAYEELNPGVDCIVELKSPDGYQ